MHNINEIIKSDIRASLTKSGLMLFLAGFLIFMGIITSELFYTADFSARDNYISELAEKISIKTDDFRRMSAYIFDYTMIAAGLMIIAGTWFLHKIFRKYLLTVPMYLFGAGLACSGIRQLPADSVLFITILCGSVAAIVSFKVVNTPLRYIFACFGIIVLIMLIFPTHFITILGAGGAERWLFYPIVFWITGMGTYLLGIKDGHKNTIRS